MERRCPNCDQLLLADETACWQCGQPLPQPAQSSPGAPERQERAARRPPPVLAIYAAWTAVLIVAALAATVLLGRQPRVQAANVPLPEGWIVVSDRQRTFTMFLPEEWERLDAGADDDARRRLQQLMDDVPAYRQATEPLTGFVQDEEPLFLAQGSGLMDGGAPGAFVIVTRSRLLNRLTPAEALGLAQEGDVTVTDARRVADYDRRYVALRVELPAPGQEMVCRQQFTTGEREALVLALCAAPGRLSAEAIDAVLGSAQRLAP